MNEVEKTFENEKEKKENLKRKRTETKISKINNKEKTEQAGKEQKERNNNKCPTKRRRIGKKKEETIIKEMYPPLRFLYTTGICLNSSPKINNKYSKESLNKKNVGFIIIKAVFSRKGLSPDLGSLREQV